MSATEERIKDLKRQLAEACAKRDLETAVASLRHAVHHVDPIRLTVDQCRALLRAMGDGARENGPT